MLKKIKEKLKKDYDKWVLEQFLLICILFCAYTYCCILIIWVPRLEIYIHIIIVIIVIIVTFIMLLLIKVIYSRWRWNHFFVYSERVIIDYIYSHENVDVMLGINVINKKFTFYRVVLDNFVEKWSKHIHDKFSKKNTKKYIISYSFCPCVSIQWKGCRFCKFKDQNKGQFEHYEGCVEAVDFSNDLDDTCIKADLDYKVIIILLKRKLYNMFWDSEKY